MNTPLTFGRIRRILIAFDASNASVAALESATALAVRLEAELVGVYIEDVNLLRLADLPFARAISATFAQRRALTAVGMERALRAQAAHAEQAMARLLARHAVAWRFRTVRGQVATELLAAAREADLIALGLGGPLPGGAPRLGATARALLRAAPRPVLLTAPGVALRAPLLVLYDGSSASARALALAAALARLEAEPLIVAIPSAEADAAERLQAAAAAQLADLGIAGRWRFMRSADPVWLARLVESEGAGTLVLPDRVVHDEEAVQALLCRLRCPVLLVC